LRPILPGLFLRKGNVSQEFVRPPVGLREDTKFLSILPGFDARWRLQGCGRRGHPGSARGCRSSLFSHRCGPAIPGPYEYRSHRPSPAGESPAVERLFQDMLVKEQNGGESLIPGGRGDVLLDRQMRQEAVGVALAKLAGMPVPVKLDGAANPMHVSFFRASGVMADWQNLDRAVVETGRGLVG